MAENTEDAAQQIERLKKELAIALDVKALSDSEDAILRNYDAEIAKIEARWQWRPIESAPKDGTELLLYGPFVPTGETYTDVGRWNDYGDGFWDWGGDDSQPTHWMPLPLPPEAK